MRLIDEVVNFDNTKGNVFSFAKNDGYTGYTRS